MRGAHHPLHPETRKALGRRAGAPAPRRSCCSTAAAGRTSSPAAAAAGCGCARSATSRWCCTGPGAGRPVWPATTAATASASPTAARRARRRRWRATARAPSASSTSCARRSATTAFPCSASTPTRRRARTRVARTLARFEAAPAGVLVGTQMVAKGHDFADVTLGVVLDADQTLRFPDFRAEERTFALITQLAGRAGRGPDGGPRARADACAVGALDRVRRPPRRRRASSPTSSRAASALRYPPFGSLIRVVCSARAAGPRDRRWPPSCTVGSRRRGPTVLGPAPLFRLRGRVAQPAAC